MTSPKRFFLNRLVDESGMSGIGEVAHGVELPNGMAVMWWLVPPYSVQVYESIEALHKVHRHGDKRTTEIVWVANERYDTILSRTR